jgi:predicted nucleic acid-binding protein
MSFWDSSALLPLVIEEPMSALSRRLLRAHPAAVVWWGSLVECTSALERRQRAGQLKPADRRHAGQLLVQLAEVWSEVEPSRVLRERALRLLSSHNLRAADALQLAAALVWAEERPAGRTFICLDERLREAARQDGFLVLPEIA